jgi:oxygen-independent coproporphyrinogen-3 oxidase
VNTKHVLKILQPCTFAHQALALAGGVRERANAPVRSLYIHVPFCFHKCHYCDFYSIVDTRDRQEAFTARLCDELVALAPLAAGQPLATIFVGGGTPSLLRVDLWKRVLACLHERFDMSLMQSGAKHELSCSDGDGNGDAAGDGEFTVECNPETVSPELMATLRAGGVTRVSIGAQSFHAQHLKTLERWHDPANVEKALRLARAAGIGRASIDLIYSIPGQTLEEWDSDLRTALGLGLTHLSCYALTYEPNTAMAVRLRKGEFVPSPEDLEADMFEHTLRTLRGAGLDRYEVSNFAARGEECRHNLAYWRQEEWLAAGPSASAHIGGVRYKNTPRLDDYLELRTPEGFAAVVDVEGPDARRALGEMLWTGLRMREGVDAGAALARANALDAATAARLDKAIARQVAFGAVVHDGARWRLSDEGFLIADRVAVEMLEAVDG